MVERALIETFEDGEEEWFIKIKNEVIRGYGRNSYNRIMAILFPVEELTIEELDIEIDRLVKKRQLLLKDQIQNLFGDV